MIDRDQNKPTAKVSAPLDETGQAENLPYRVELWDGPANQVERLLARATNAMLARAIFKEAQSEFPGRRITVRDGAKIIADSQKS